MKTIHSKQTKICNITSEESNIFLNVYHKQGVVNGQLYCYGLKYEEQLVAVMTFGYARYNNNVDYELLRLCFHNDYNIRYGAGKMFNAFINEHKPKTIVSYCDTAYFTGKVYEALKFELINRPKVSYIWRKGDKWITHAQLMKYGPDKLIGTKDGLGTDNEEIMIREGWAKIERAPQLTYAWSANCDGKIYLIENAINDKKYVGQTIKELSNRFKVHCKSNSLIGRAIRKYDKSNFTIKQIDSADNYYDLNKKEIKWISHYDCVKNGYNVYNGGSGYIIKNVDENQKDKQRRAMRKYYDDPEYIKQISDNTKAQWENEEYRKKNLSARKKTYSTNESKKQRSEAMKKRWENEEYKKNHSDIMREKWKDEEYKIHMSNKQKEKWENEDFRKNQIAHISANSKKRWQNEEYKKSMREVSSNNLKKLWENEDFRKKKSDNMKEINATVNVENKEQRANKQKEKWKDEEFRNKMSKKRKAQWENEEYREKIKKTRAERKEQISKSISNAVKGRKWYNNGIIQKQTKNPPEGFVLGKLKKEKK